MKIKFFLRLNTFVKLGITTWLLARPSFISQLTKVGVNTLKKCNIERTSSRQSSRKYRSEKSALYDHGAEPSGTYFLPCFNR